MFTSEYLESIAKKYCCDKRPTDKDLELLLNHLRNNGTSLKYMTINMLGDMITGKKTVMEIIEKMGRAGRYNDMLSLYTNHQEKLEEVRKDRIKASKDGDTEKVEECRRQIEILAEKIETAWAMIQISGATLTQVAIGDRDTYTWVVDVDRA